MNTQQKCCKLCRPTSLEIMQGLNTCRITVCGCHYPVELSQKECEYCVGGVRNTDTMELCNECLGTGRRLFDGVGKKEKITPEEKAELIDLVRQNREIVEKYAPSATVKEEELPITRKDAQKYRNIHNYLVNHYGKANKCEDIYCKKRSKNFDWALKKGRIYTRNADDYLQLCRSCHARYDSTEEGRKRISKFQKGRKKPIRSLIHRQRLSKSNKESFIRRRDQNKII